MGLKRWKCIGDGVVFGVDVLKRAVFETAVKETAKEMFET